MHRKMNKNFKKNTRKKEEGGMKLFSLKVCKIPKIGSWDQNGGLKRVATTITKYM